MNIKEFLSEIQATPDRLVNSRYGRKPLLTTKLGIYDNFPIKSSLDYEKLNHFVSEAGFSLKQDDPGFGERTIYSYDQGIVIAQVLASPGSTPDPSFSPNHKRHHQKHRETYRSRIVLHPYQEPRTGDIVTDVRAIADVVALLARKAMDEDVSIAINRGGIGFYDPGKIVYYPDWTPDT